MVGRRRAKAPGPLERAPARDQHRLLVDGARGVEEGVEVRGVRRRELRDGGAQPVALAGEVQAHAVLGPVDAVEGVERPQGQLVVEVAAREREQLAQEPRHRDQARPGVPGVAALDDPPGPPARRRPPLDDGHLEPQRPQPQRRREPAEPGADDDGAATPHARFPSARQRTMERQASASP